jgi:hypothetical protein
MRRATSSAKLLGKILVVAAVATLAIGAGSGVAGAATDAAAANVPVTGTTSDGGTFNGTMSIQDVTTQNGQLVALGTVSGTVTDAAGNTVGNIAAAPFAAPVAAQQKGGCTLFSFSFGPFDVNVAGLITLHIEPIAADVELNGLLATLLCGLLGGGGTPPPVPA